ncbi:MAG TPA: NAD(P)/FAD-dependent oxidoreductase [Burkholderiaceae bacterium]|nr:NAD(P)/FAD-dependent oxidoreductase [Burkholderiaceae bacterium]
MNEDTDFDLAIVGAGIGGVICLKYAQDAGLKAVLLERRERVGGVWRDLPSWQDIQFRREDWTLEDLPLCGVDQASILSNIEAWVERFGLAPSIRLNSPVESARWESRGWEVRAGTDIFRATYLVAASGGHNRPRIPDVARRDSSVVEFHSSALHSPQLLRGKRVTVVGGGASAYDLLDLCIEHEARRVVWVYPSAKWMRPTLQPKHLGVDMRRLSQWQMLGLPVAVVNWLINRDLRKRYAKAGVAPIKPDGDFDLRRHQLIPGRRLMLRHFNNIERHVAEVRSIAGTTIGLSNGDAFDSDVLLWGTGHSVELDYLQPAIPHGLTLADLSRRCCSAFRSTDAPNLFLLAPGVLETNTSTPWAYAHAARSIMSHVHVGEGFKTPPQRDMINHYDLVKVFARDDRRSYPRVLWYAKYLRLAMWHPRSRPMPMP